MSHLQNTDLIEKWAKLPSRSLKLKGPRLQKGKVGLIGSTDPSSALLVRSRTPQNIYVKGLVNKEGKVMCVSQAMSGKPQL